MRYLLLLLLLASCRPTTMGDTLYFRHCKHGCLRAGHLRARVIETETGFSCECSAEEKGPEHGPT